MTRTDPHPLRPAQGEDDGFSLVEVLVAVVVLAVMSLAVFSGLVQALGAGSRSKARTVAAAIAAQELEAYDAVAAVPTIAEGTWQKEQDVAGQIYKITTTATWQPAVVVPGADRCAGPGTGGHPYMRVTVAVKGPGKAPTVRSETLLTPKAGTGPVDSATQRVRVLTRSGAARSGVVVSLSGLTTGTSPATTGTTDSFGCVVFSGLKDGSYRASVSIAGQVGLAGTQVASRDVTISSATTPRLVEIFYDTAAVLDVSMAVVSTHARLPRAPVTVVNSGMQPGGQKTQQWATASSGLPETTVRLPSLFPFASGYQAWMGSCPDADPVRHGASRPLVTLTGGTTPVALTVGGGRVEVFVRKLQANSSGNYDPVRDMPVDATDSCGATFRLAGLTASNGTTNGRLTALLPYGTWTFRAGTAAAQDAAVAVVNPTTERFPVITVH